MARVPTPGASSPIRARGCVCFVGRRYTMIKSSGFRVSPTEVEQVMFEIGRLKSAVVPEMIEPFDQMPKTTSGKVECLALRRREGL